MTQPAQNKRASGLGSVVVGVDGSPNAAEAIERAVELATASGARVIAVHAIGLLVQLHPGGPCVPVETCRDELQKVFEEEWCHRLQGRGVEYTAELVAGEAVGALLSVAGREDAWAIVVGMRGHRPFGTGPLGSTSLQLVFDSPWPVLVVPPPAGRG